MIVNLSTYMYMYVDVYIHTCTYMYMYTVCIHVHVRVLHTIACSYNGGSLSSEFGDSDVIHMLTGWCPQSVPTRWVNTVWDTGCSDSLCSQTNPLRAGGLPSLPTGPMTPRRSIVQWWP